MSRITNILGTDCSENYANSNAFLSTLKKEYNAIIESIQKYNGFWIGRYESSLVNEKTKVIAGTTSMNDSENTSYYWYGIYARQKKFKIDNNLDTIESTMVYGSQYDAMMLWMINTGIDVASSTPIDGAVKNLTRINGTEQYDKLNNIYDLLGNSYEWTSECVGCKYRTSRGGLSNSGVNDSPSKRYSGSSPLAYGGFTSSRIVLIID